MRYYEIYLYNGDEPKQLLASSDYNPGILDPHVDKEINTAGSFSFTILPTHELSSQIKRYTSRVDVVLKGKTIFRGRVTSISSDIYSQKKIECEGALAYLMDSVVDIGHDTTLKVYYIHRAFGKFLEGHNSQVESWKRLYVGYYEHEGSENLISPDNIIPGYYDYAGRYSEATEEGQEKSTNELYPFESVQEVIAGEVKTFSYVYTFSLANVTRPLVNPSPLHWKYCITLYDADKNIIVYESGDKFMEYEMVSDEYRYGVSTSISFKKSDYWTSSSSHASGVTREPKYFRISAETHGHEMWLQKAFTYAENLKSYSELESPEISGDSFSSLFVDGRTNMFRTRVENDTVYVDCLNGKRNISNSSLTFGVNILDVNLENPDLEPYSIIVPVSKNKYYYTYDAGGTGHVLEVEDQTAISLFGRISKVLDVGVTSDDGRLSENTAIQRAKNYLRLYNALIPTSLEIKALDSNIYFDNDTFDMIDVGDPVSVKVPQLENSVTLICLSLSLDLLNPSNNSYKIGHYIQEGEDIKIESLTKSFSKTKKKK